MGPVVETGAEPRLQPGDEMERVFADAAEVGTDRIGGVETD